MRNKINFYLLEYAINVLIRQKYKTIFITLVLSLIVFLLSSVFFITNSIKYELELTLDYLPEIIVQNTQGLRQVDIDVAVVDDILDIAGVSSAQDRVWGYYKFYNAGVNFSIVGIGEFEEQYKNSFTNIVDTFDFSANSMVVGKGVYRVMKNNYFEDTFNFIKPNGKLKTINIAGIFKAETELESNDVIVLSKSNVREIFDISEDKATDIVVRVANKDEIETVAIKIKQLFPNARVITKDDLKVSYQNIFDYKSGVFLALFIMSLFTFFIIIYDRASGLSSAEKLEIGVLKAIGWSVEDILKEKFYEGFIISFFAYLLGVVFALGFVYILNAPILQNIFIGYSKLKTSFELPFVLDIQTLSLVFFLSVPIYIAAIIVPSWRTSILEVDEVIR